MRSGFIIYFLIVTILFFSNCGCSTEPPVAPDPNKIIMGNDSTIELKYFPDLKGIQKTVMIEDFANVSCIPCVLSNRILESLVNNTFGRSSIVVVKYPTNFPSPNDPFYLANSSVCEARRKFYDVFTAPTNVIDGILKPSPTDSNDVKNKIRQRLLSIPKFRIIIQDSIFKEIYYIKFIIEIRDTSGVDPNNITCNIVVTETEINFNNPPGSNGETRFYDVMRVMLPAEKQKYNINTVQSASVFNVRQIKIDPGWNRQKLHTVIFLQDKPTKEIIQAGSSFTMNN